MNSLCKLAIIMTLAASAQELFAQDDLVLFDGAPRKLWTFAGLSGGSLSIVNDPFSKEKRTLLLFSAEPGARPWAAAHFTSPAPSMAGIDAITLTKELRKSGRLVFLVNAAEDEWGAVHGGQKIQVSLGQRIDKLTWLCDPLVPMDAYIEGGKIDDAPSTWQKVSIPLEKILAKDANCIGCVTFQFQEMPPSSGILIDKLRIEK